MAITIQTGAHQFNSAQITKYALTLGGLNTTQAALRQWDPLITNYPRLFMVRKPIALMRYFSSNDTDRAKFEAFKHLLEYGNLGVTGLQNTTVDFDQIKGGYGGREFQIPKGTTNGTTDFTVKMLELSGSPIREMIHTWVNMVVDLDTSLLHYNGMVAAGQMGYSQASHTAEFIFVSTDRSGMKVEYAAHLTNCFPMEIPTDHFNADDPSDHKHVEYDLKFTASAREGFDVNEKAKQLLKAHQIMTNSLEYCTGLDDLVLTPTGYNPKTGLIEERRGGSLSSIKLGEEGKASDNTYRTAIGGSNVSNEEVAAGVKLYNSEEDRYRPTPSYTEYGNRKYQTSSDFM